MRSTLPFALLFAACNGTSGPEPAPFSDCDPLIEDTCALPWPSTFFMEKDPSTASGWRVALREHSLPMNRDDVQIRPDAWNRLDGFSTLGTLLLYYRDVDPATLVGQYDVGASIADDATILVFDAETGERVPYFAEIDASAEVDRERLILIHPAEPMRHATRYIVAVRGLRTLDGNAVPISKAFESLRDGTPHESWDVEGRRDYYETDIFPAIEAQGIARADLQLAWDFVTISTESSLGEATWMRDDAAAREGEDGPDYVITSVEDEACSSGASIGRTIYGEMAVPLYTDSDAPGSVLFRDDDGHVANNGLGTAKFMVRVPCSLIEDPKPGFILQYGHGLLGDLGEARSGYLSNMANENGWVVVATNWKGMYSADRGAITLMLSDDPSNFNTVPERSLQGFIEQDALLRLARGALVNDEHLIFDGVSVLDPDRFGYYGNSQGAILGGGYLGMSNQLSRGVLGVGGAPYALLLQRSADFDPFFLIFIAKFTDHRDITLLITAFQTLWDPAETAGWARVINEAPLEGSASKDVLLQVAIGDAQVSTLGAQILARSFGARSIAPQNREIWGVEEAPAPLTGSAIVEWQYQDGSHEPAANVPPNDDGDTHECPRREPAAQSQLKDFLETGTINQYCDGPCVGVRAGFCD